MWVCIFGALVKLFYLFQMFRVVVVVFVDSLRFVFFR